MTMYVLYLYCDSITEERAVARLRHGKQLISVTTTAQATEERCFYVVCAEDQLPLQEK
jgi:hypothetical protein